MSGMFAGLQRHLHARMDKKFMMFLIFWQCLKLKWWWACVLAGWHEIEAWTYRESRFNWGLFSEKYPPETDPQNTCKNNSIWDYKMPFGFRLNWFGVGIHAVGVLFNPVRPDRKKVGVRVKFALIGNHWADAIDHLWRYWDFSPYLRIKG